MTEEIRLEDDLNVSLASAKKRRAKLYRRFLNLNPRFVSEAGAVGLYTGTGSMEFRSTEELVRIEGSEIIVPVIGDVFSFNRGINPSAIGYVRKDFRKPTRRPVKKKRKGGKK